MLSIILLPLQMIPFSTVNVIRHLISKEHDKAFEFEFDHRDKVKSNDLFGGISMQDGFAHVQDHKVTVYSN